MPTQLSGAEILFRHHLAHRGLPVRNQTTGDYGLTALVNLDKDGDLDFVTDGDTDIVWKPWGPQPWNGAGGKMHVDFLENVRLSR